MQRPIIENPPCRGHAELFFFTAPYGKEELAKEREAKRLCHQCPVIEECLTYSLYHEEFGLWGGMTERQRRILRRRLKIKLIKPEADTINFMGIKPEDSVQQFVVLR